ncbi:MAG TPA: hypothetical protein VHU92_06720 [Streptosporangiaceae bacterium]|nr:hypothetical protein [Streptosporangiaceae bacterium]
MIILVTLLHVAAFAVMIMIRLRRDERDRATGDTGMSRPCAVCSAPATHLGYDGLDPDERRDPHTGRAYSTDVTHYRPLCAAH